MIWNAAIMIVLASTSLAACGGGQSRDIPARSAVQFTRLKSFSPWHSRLLLLIAGIRGVSVRDRVDCYRVIYRTHDSGGRPLQVSGLMALPGGKAPKGLVSFQHGTTTTRSAVPSNLSLDGLAAAVVFAGNGYAMIAPDYIGQGVSDRPHPYYVAEDAARAVVDMIAATRDGAGAPNARPFLIGFSEGAYASLAAQREMESRNEAVLGVAAISGAYHLRDVTLPTTLAGGARQDSLYLALWVRGYADHYRHALDEVFTPLYARLIPVLFDHPHSPAEIVRALPRNPREMFAPGFLRALDQNRRHWLLDALRGNDVANWSPRAPVRLYYGLKDVDVRPDEALSARKTLSHPGNDVEAVNLGAVDHGSAVLAAAPDILHWLDRSEKAAEK